MTVTRSTIRKGAGALSLKRTTDNTVFWLKNNVSYEFTKSLEEGEDVTGMVSDGTEQILDTAGATETYTLTIETNVNSLNLMATSLNSMVKNVTNQVVPWAEEATVAAGAVTLKNTTSPVASNTYVTYKDGEAPFTMVGVAPSTAGECQDNGDGTLTFHSSDNGKDVVIWYSDQATCKMIGGDQHTEVGNVEAIMYAKSGTSDVTDNIGVDQLWLPKCSVIGDSSFLFSKDVEPVSFQLKAVVPDLTGWTKPYALLLNREVNNANAG
jgi:hypothetical protein